MQNDFIDIPVQINDKYSTIFGIHRTAKDTRRIVVFIPAESGTRIGPQRIYVESARKLAANGIASLCVELPSSGDSFFNSKSVEGLFQIYFTCLDTVTNYIKDKFNYNEIILASISIGCIPTYNYALKNNLNHLVFLSPALLPEDSGKVNKDNLRKYYRKLFKKETWFKILHFKLNIKRILLNTVNTKKSSKKDLNLISSENQKINITAIYGGNDAGRISSEQFWNGLLTENKINKFTSYIIEGSDHSFFSWNFKQQVSDRILESVI